MYVSFCVIFQNGEMKMSEHVKNSLDIKVGTHPPTLPHSYINCAVLANIEKTKKKNLRENVYG